MKKFINQIPPFFKSFYFLATFFFLFWLAFIDSNDLFFQAELSRKKTELEKAREFYQDKILQVKNDQEALKNNPDLLEKIAREKYLMKKPNEDLYIVVKEEE
jgi:cell division protein FtsB